MPEGRDKFCLASNVRKRGEMAPSKENTTDADVS